MRLLPIFLAVLLLPGVAPAAETFPQLRAWAGGAELDGEPRATAPGTLEERLARGKELFGPTCVRCHGFDSRGGGGGGVGMDPPPANLVDRPVKFRSTPGDAKPTELDLFRTITRGLHGTGMPPFIHLPESDRWALAAWVRSMQPGREADALAVPSPPADLDTPSRIERGAGIFAAQACAACHAGPLALEMRIPKRSRAAAELFSTIEHGIPGTAMPPRAFPPAELWDLVAYVRSRLPAAGSQGPHAQEQEAMEQVIDACADNL